MNKFTVNNKVYFVRELDFNYLADLDMEGIDVTKIASVAALGFFLSYCSNGKLTRQEANSEISQHLINGGKMDDISEAYKDALEESAFFRALLGEAEAQSAEVEETATKTQKKSIKKEKEVSE